MRSSGLVLFGIFFQVIVAQAAIAQNKVVVIPMAGDDLKPLANVITVAKQNGDFADPITAMASITDASQSNPYLVVIAPGVYDIGSNAFNVKSFVSVAGSGPKITVLESSRTSATSGAISLSDDSSIQDLSLNVTGTSSASQTAFGGIGHDRVVIRNLHILMDNANAATRYGLYARVGDWSIYDSRIEIAGGTGTAIGIFSNFAGTDVLIDNSIIIVPNETGNDPINFSLGGTVSAYCNFVRTVDNDAISTSSILDPNCD